MVAGLKFGYWSWTIYKLRNLQDLFIFLQRILFHSVKQTICFTSTALINASIHTNRTTPSDGWLSSFPHILLYTWRWCGWVLLSVNLFTEFSYQLLPKLSITKWCTIPCVPTFWWGPGVTWCSKMHNMSSLPQEELITTKRPVMLLLSHLYHCCYCHHNYPFFCLCYFQCVDSGKTLQGLLCSVLALAKCTLHDEQV